MTAPKLTEAELHRELAFIEATGLLTGELLEIQIKRMERAGLIDFFEFWELTDAGRAALRGES